ncbi:unnamed protein product [Cunninghamella blakesleeana]
MFTAVFQTLSKSIKRQSTSWIRQPSFTITTKSQGQPPLLKRNPYIFPTISAIFATGLTYSVMATQHHEALLEQKQIFNGEHTEHYQLGQQELDNLDIVKNARENPDLFEIQPYSQLKDSAKLQSLTASTLRGKGKIVVPPAVFYNQNRTEVTIVCHLGTELCGHEGYIHGGMLATLLDECLACVAMPSLPNYVGFTANLNIDYRKPVKSDQWVVLRGKLSKIEGRKAYVEAWIEDLEGQHKLVEATSLYISPKATPLARVL